jgi:hypothetical protein
VKQRERILKLFYSMTGAPITEINMSVGKIMTPFSSYAPGKTQADLSREIDWPSWHPTLICSFWTAMDYQKIGSF